MDVVWLLFSTSVCLSLKPTNVADVTLIRISIGNLYISPDEVSGLSFHHSLIFHCFSFSLLSSGVFILSYDT
jgi:hypothetical protein